QDDQNLIAFLKEELLAENDVVTVGASEWSVALRFKNSANVSDERLHAALVNIYREAVTELNVPTQHDGQTLAEAEQRRRSIVFWLGTCSDDATKSFLLRLVADTAQNSSTRIIAVASYLRAANAQEAKEVLVRLLISESRMDSQTRSSIISHAHMAYTEAGQEKKRAIIESLYVALASEDAKWLFRVYDNILSHLSQQYADSRQRRDILKRLINATPTCLADELALPDLKARLDRLQKIKPTTDISTNLAVLNSRDFSQPPPGGDAVAVAAEVTTEPTTTTRVSGVTLRVLGGLLLIALAAIGMWSLMRTREPRH
ncbi:MAG: hypothetical protein GX230_10250, partial [Lentisphaerae bacterium]|nr:hypothetical protein [Lentisphaerota bacterium]